MQPLPDELFARPLQLDGVTTLRQRLHLPATQPHTVDGLHPAHKSLSIKRSVRCGQCEHYVIKPEFNPASIKYRIHSLASGHVPVVRLMQPLPAAAGGLRAGQPGTVRVKFINPTAHDMRIGLHGDGDGDGGAVADELSLVTAGAVLQLPDGGVAFVVQRRDDSTEFDGDSELPDEPPFVVWRRSNAVVVELTVQPPATARRGDELCVALAIGHNYVNAYPGATATVAAATAATAGPDGGADRSAGPTEHALLSRVYLKVGRVQ